MTDAELNQKARDAFARRDELVSQLAAVDRELQALRGDYMQMNRMWGVRPEGFRNAVFTVGIAA